MTDHIEWGPVIPVDGKRPDWLKDDELVLPKWLELWYEVTGAPAKCVSGWERVTAIRLPADHPYYSKPARRPSVVKAAELIASECERRGVDLAPERYRKGDFDRAHQLQAFAKYINETEKLDPDPLDEEALEICRKHLAVSGKWSDDEIRRLVAYKAVLEVLVRGRSK